MRRTYRRHPFAIYLREQPCRVRPLDERVHEAVAGALGARRVSFLAALRAAPKTPQAKLNTFLAEFRPDFPRIPPSSKDGTIPPSIGRTLPASRHASITTSEYTSSVENETYWKRGVSSPNATGSILVSCTSWTRTMTTSYPEHPRARRNRRCS